MKDFNRRKFIVTAAAGASAIALPLNSVWGAARDTLVYASAEPVTGNWDPNAHTNYGQQTFETFVFGTLFRTPMKPENPQEIVWELATSADIIEPYILEIKLRDGVTFHNGAPFSAEDIKATYEYATSGDTAKAGFYPGPVEVEVVDRLTARLHTKGSGFPAAAFFFTGAFTSILSKDDVKDKSVLAERPNGTGFFKFLKQNGNVSELQAFEEYFKGKPKVEFAHFSYVPDASTRVLGLMSGDIHLLERLEPEQFNSLKTRDNVKTWSNASSENKYLHFRCNKPPFDDARVRLAACHAIDRAQILAILGEAGIESNSFIAPTKLGSESVPNYPRYDPGKCQELLRDAGYPNGKGLPKLEYITSQGFYPKTKEYGEVITAMLQQEGFNVELTVTDPATWNEMLYQRKSEKAPGHMIDCGWITASPEPDLVLGPMFKSTAGPRGGIINGIQSDRIDAALDAEAKAEDNEKRAKLVEKANEVIAAEMPSLSLFTSVNLNASSKNLGGIYIYPDGGIDFTDVSFD